MEKEKLILFLEANYNDNYKYSLRDLVDYSTLFLKDSILNQQAELLKHP